MDCDDILIGVGSGKAVEVDRLLPTRPTLGGQAGASVIDEDPADGFGGGRKEVLATVELLIPDEPQVGFVNEGGGIEGVAGGFDRQARRRRASAARRTRAAATQRRIGGRRPRRWSKRVSSDMAADLSARRGGSTYKGGIADLAIGRGGGCGLGRRPTVGKKFGQTVSWMMRKPLRNVARVVERVDSRNKLSSPRFRRFGKLGWLG